MSALDVESLLKEVSADKPCGDDLEYDPEFGELEREAQGAAAQEMGDAVIEAREPDWKAVRKKSLALFSRTKDLRVAVLLTRAVLRLEGIVAFRDGLALVHGMIERYWEQLYPPLDPDDDNDPTMRINVLVTLCDRETLLRELRETPLVRSRTMGQFSFRDILTAQGELPAPADREPPKMATIEAAFLDGDLEELKAIGAALAEAMQLIQSIEDDVTKRVSVAHAASFAPLADLLRGMNKVVAEQLERRGVRAEPEPAVAQAEATNGAGSVGGAQAPQRLAGEISTREDVLKALDKICEYYEKHEPSSPVPLLLHRAKRLATKSFLEILRDLSPGGLDQARAIGGISPDDGA